MDKKQINDYKNKFSGKRLAAFDFGMKRIGFAVCDEFHISITPQNVFYSNDANLWNDIKNVFDNESYSGIIIGVPYKSDGSKSDLELEINIFIEKLKEITDAEIIKYDESYSSKRAVSTMVEIGTKKKNRRKKENIDKVSAAIILRDFLLELEGF
jgi:putative holliday junction resolvase